MWEFLKNFFQIKKIIALLTTITFCVLALKGNLEKEQFMTIFSIIIAFYFSQSAIRQSINENNRK